MSNLNNELDLGMKIIDNSFEVSGFDYDYANSNIFSNSQSNDESQVLSNDLKTCVTGSENSTFK